MLATGKAQHVIRKNRCITVNNKDPTFDITHGAAHRILHNSLQFHEVSSSWVPWQPNLNWRKGTHTCQRFLWWYAAAGGWLLNCPVTRYGRWPNTSSLIYRWKAKDGAIPAHNNPEILHMSNSVKSDADVILASPRLTCEHCMSKKISHQCLILWPP